MENKYVFNKYKKKCKDIVGKSVDIGDWVIFYSVKKGSLIPARLVEQIKGDLHKVEMGYFLRKTKEPYIPPDPEIAFHFVTQMVKINPEGNIDAK